RLHRGHPAVRRSVTRPRAAAAARPRHRLSDDRRDLRQRLGDRVRLGPYLDRALARAARGDGRRRRRGADRARSAPGRHRPEGLAWGGQALPTGPSRSWWEAGPAEPALWRHACGMGSVTNTRAVPSALRSLSASTSPTTARANEPERCAWGSTRHGSGRRPLRHPPRRYRLQRQEPSRARRRTARPGLQPQPHDLRPPPPAPPRPHPTPPPQQHLRPHRGRHPCRRLLQQTPKPAAATAPRRRPATSTPDVRRALTTLERAVHDYTHNARLGLAAP